MIGSRRSVLATVVLVLGLITGMILLEVLGTVLFAITVAFVLIPVKRWLVRRGLSTWTGTLVATFVGFVGAIAIFAPVVLTLYVRRGELLELVEGLPEEVLISVFGFSTSVNAAELQLLATEMVQTLILSFAAACRSWQSKAHCLSSYCLR